MVTYLAVHSNKNRPEAPHVIVNSISDTTLINCTDSMVLPGHNYSCTCFLYQLHIQLHNYIDFDG